LNVGEGIYLILILFDGPYNIIISNLSRYLTNLI
jgi:hypothetical protein